MTDSTPPPPSRTQRVLIGLSVVFVALLGLYPFRVVLDHFPWKVDAVKWVVRGASDRQEWMDWVFATSHFVGYRPVAAISYTINHWFTGFDPVFYRATDLGLQGLVTISVALLFRSLVGRTDAWMILPALLFAGHPAAEEIVPFLARRSYLLSTMFSTLGLALWIEGLRRDQVLSVHSFGAAVALVFAVLSNEVAYVVLPLLPLFALHLRGPGLLKALERCIPTYAGALVAIVLRFAIIGWAGGYHKHYFAGTRRGLKTLRQASGWNGHEIVGAAFDYVWFPVAMRGTANPLRTDGLTADLLWATLPAVDLTTGLRLLLFGVVATYTWNLVFAPLFDSTSRHRRLGWLFVVWMLGYALLFGLSRTWFWRQGYPMVVPLALLVSWMARDTWVNRRARWMWIPQGVFMVSLLWHSPMVHGMSHHKMGPRFQANRMIHTLPSILPTDLDRATIYLVVPGNKGSTKTTRRWLGRMHRTQTIRWQVLATGMPTNNLVRLEGNTLHFSNKAILTARDRENYNITGNILSLEDLPTSKRPAWLVYPDSEGVWQAVDLKSR